MFGKRDFEVLIDEPGLAVVRDHGRLRVDRVPGVMPDIEVRRHLVRLRDSELQRQIAESDREFDSMRQRVKRGEQ